MLIILLIIISLDIKKSLLGLKVVIYFLYMNGIIIKLFLLIEFNVCF